MVEHVTSMLAPNSMATAQHQLMSDKEKVKQPLQTKPLAASVTLLAQRQAMPEEEQKEEPPVQTRPLAESIAPFAQRQMIPDEEKKEEQPVQRPIDLNYHPRYEPPDPTNLPSDFWKPIPPAPKGSGPKSPLDVIGEKILDPVIDTVAGGLSKNLRGKIKEGARDAVKSGVAKGARAVAEAAGLTDTKSLDAVEKAAEAAIQEKGKTTK
jgi:hypothetical protein